MKTFTTVSVISVLMIFVPCAKASTVTVSFDTHVPSRSLSLPISFDGTVSTHYAGLFQISIDNGPLQDVMCADLRMCPDGEVVADYRIFSSSDPAAVSLSPQIDRVAWIAANYMPQVNWAGREGHGYQA